MRALMLAAVLAGLASAPAALAAAPLQTVCLQPPPGAPRWSQPASWPSGSVPQAGDCVTIPQGTTMYLDVSTAPLGGLEIQGALVFLCGPLTLTSDWIRVTGTLQCGTQAHPFHDQAKIQLTHSYSCNAGEQQTLAVEGTGLLRLIGSRRAPSWTRLASTAPASSSILSLQAAPAWSAGQTVVIASTDFDRTQAEVRTIASVAGAQVTLTQPLTYAHWGASEGQSYDGVGVPEYAEVALLERNVVIEGTPYVDASGKTFGGHVILHNPGASAPRAQLAWVELRDLGKEGTLGKYPLHFHQIGDATSSYVRYCSIHRSYNRAISIHTTQNLEVQDNFCYDVLGHAYYFEDDPVTGCNLSRNLGLLTEVPEYPTIPSDELPATFWLHNPDNVVEDNAAAGAAAYGFWFETDSTDATPWTSFRGNVSHSNKLSGFFQDTRPKPSPESVYEDMIAYKNREYGVWLRSYGTSRIKNARLADNRGGFYLASEGFQFDALTHVLTGSLADPLGISKTIVEDSLVIGESTNLGKAKTCEELAYGRSLAQAFPDCCGPNLPKWSALTGVELYDGLIGVEDTIFADFQDLSVPTPGCSSATFERKAGAFHQVRYNSPWAMDPRNYASGLSFINAVPVYLRTPNGVFALFCGSETDDGGVANSILYDLDGSVTGVAGSSIFPDGPFEDFLVPLSGATKITAWNAYVTPGPPSTPFAQLDLFNMNEYLPTPLPAAEVVGFHAPLRGEWFVKPGPLFYGCNPSMEFRIPRYVTNVITDDIYEVHYDPLAPQAEWARAFTLALQYTEPGRWAYVTVPLLPPTPPSTLQVRANYVPISPAPDPVTLFNGTTDGYWYDAASQRIHMKLFTGGSAPGTIFEGTRSVLLVVSL